MAYERSQTVWTLHEEGTSSEEERVLFTGESRNFKDSGNRYRMNPVCSVRRKHKVTKTVKGELLTFEGFPSPSRGP